MLMNKKIYLFLLVCWLCQSCIQDDIIFDTVPESLRITTLLDTLAVGDTFQLETRYTNNIGEVESLPIQWLSTAPEIAEVSSTGLVTGIAEGETSIFATVDGSSNFIADTLSLLVKNNVQTVVTDQSRSGQIQTTSSYVLRGDFTVLQEDQDLIIAFSENYEASRSLPGLYVYLTNNPNSVADALEIGKVETFSGAHSYRIASVDISAYDYLFYYCKPFRVKVGDGSID